jgi:hypothetical protein
MNAMCTDYILIFLLNETDVQFAVSADLFPRGKWFAMSKLSKGLKAKVDWKTAVCLELSDAHLAKLYVASTLALSKQF